MQRLSIILALLLALAFSQEAPKRDAPTHLDQDWPDSSSTHITPGAPSDARIIGNKRSMIYHWPGCPNYDDIAPHNRVYFKTRGAAAAAGFRAARNCS
jgi:hypothetical protein